MKASKAEADYRGGYDETVCRNCTMFRPPDACTAVEGYIRPGALCDYFEKKNGRIAQMVGRAMRKGVPREY